MSCAEILRTQAFIDGEVADEDAETIERHIEGCADCQAFCREAAALSDDIRRLAPRHSAPTPLRRRIEASLDEQGRQGSLDRVRPKALLRPGFWSGAFSGAGVVALAASLNAPDQKPGRRSAFGRTRSRLPCRPCSSSDASMRRRRGVGAE